MVDVTKDKRHNKRFKVALEGLTGRLDDDHLVDIIDLGVGGIAIKSSRRLVVGKEYLVRLHAGRHSLEVRGTVVWSRIVDNKESPSGNRSPVSASATRFHAGSEDRVTDFISDADVTVFLQPGEDLPHKKGITFSPLLNCLEKIQ